jgi:hypothetical protein
MLTWKGNHDTCHLILAPPLKFSSKSRIFFRHGSRNLILSCRCWKNVEDWWSASIYVYYFVISSLGVCRCQKRFIDRWSTLCRSKNFCSLRFSSDITDPECINDQNFIRCVNVKIFLFVLSRCQWYIDDQRFSFLCGQFYFPYRVDVNNRCTTQNFSCVYLVKSKPSLPFRREVSLLKISKPIQMWSMIKQRNGKLIDPHTTDSI